MNKNNFTQFLWKWMLTKLSGLIIIGIAFLTVILLNISDIKNHYHTESSTNNAAPIGPEKPGIQHMMMRLSGGNYSTEAMTRANMQHQQQTNAFKLRQLNSATTVAEPQWQLRGPTNFMGRVTSIIGDPANPSKVYVGAALGGVWKTIDGGANFTQIFDNAGSLSIGALTLDPNNSDIIYVGTGEANPGGGSVTNIGDGLWKSINGGQTWELLGLENSSRIGSIVINPNNTNEIFVAAVGNLFVSSTQDRGVFRSQNGGQTWTKVLSGRNGFTGAIDVQMDPSNSNLLYAVMWEHFRKPETRDYGGLGSGIWKSTDGGNNWNQLTNNLPSINGQYGRIAFAIAPSDSSRLYAAYSEDGGSFRSFHRSDDYGQTWSSTNASFNCSTFCWWFGRLSVHPQNKDKLYAHAISLYESTNGGNSFSQYNKGFHVDHHAMWFSPNGSTIYEGNDGGVYRSTNGGNSYTHRPLPISQFYAIEVAPDNHNKILGGLQDNGSGYTTNGSSWNNLNGGDGFTVLVDNINTNCIYSESQFGVIQTTCGGSISIPGRKPWHTQMVFDESDHRKVYYGSHNLYRTTRNGTSVSTPTKISNIDFSNGPYTGTFSNSYGTISSIHVPISGNGNTIYLGTDDGNVWVSTDQGANWLQIDSNLPNRWVTRITADPQSDSIAYVSFSGYRNGELAANIFRTTNHGQSWVNISNNLPNSPVSDILIDPDYSATLYAANDFGVYVSYNTGQTWAPLGVGIPKLLVSDLKIVKEGTDILLFAGTYGRAIYSVRLNNEQRGGTGGNNQAPSFNSSPFTKSAATESQAYTDSISSNANDPDGDALTFSKISGPGWLNVASDGSLSGTPTSGDIGDNNFQVQVSDSQLTSRATMNILVNAIQGNNTLQNNVPITNLSDTQNSEKHFTMTVPATASTLNFKISGGTGDADIYVRFGSQPTAATYDCRPYIGGNNETCNITNIQAGTYHVMVKAYSAYANVSLVGHYTEGSNNTNELQNNIPITNINDSQSGEKRYTMSVPAGVSNLSFKISGGTGDADIYVRFDSQPTTSTYDCRPYISGNNETCNVTNVQQGTYHIMLKAFQNYSNVQLTGSYTN